MIILQSKPKQFIKYNIYIKTTSQQLALNVQDLFIKYNIHITTLHQNAQKLLFI